MFIIMGLIGLALAFALALLPLYLFNYDLVGFSVFFIIPIGSMLIGAIGTYGFAKGIKISNIKSSGGTFLITVLLSVLIFGGTQFGGYYMSYVDEDQGFNYKFQGIHISELFGEELSFSNFIEYKKFDINSQVISFSRRGREVGQVEGNPTVNWIFYWIDALGMLIASMLVYAVVFADETYCENCRKYYKKKKIAQVITDFSNEKERLEEIIKKESKEAADVFVSENDLKTTPTEKAYNLYNLHYCEDCNEGKLMIETHVLNQKNKYEHETSADVEIELTSNQASMFL